MLEVRMVIEMTASAKNKTLILLGLIMAITVIIAASLPQLELKPGMPIPRLENSQVVLAPIEKETLVAVSINEFFKVLFILSLIGTIMYVIYRLTRGVGWANVRYYLQLIIILSMIAASIVFLIMLLPKSQIGLQVEIPDPTYTPVATSPLGPVPVLLLWIIGIGLLISSILLGIWIFIPSRRAATIDRVGLEADKARQALIAGLDLKEVIVKCYLQMSLALEKEQGIERKDFMTTREFENLLEALGLPHDPVHQLTRLFEEVRYGNWQPHHQDEQKAINCLEAIMVSSREMKKMC